MLVCKRKKDGDRGEKGEKKRGGVLGGKRGGREREGGEGGRKGHEGLFVPEQSLLPVCVI